MKSRHTLYIVSAILLFSGCAPHPGAGVWKTTQDNAYGITEIIMSFDGKANFETTKGEIARWHCFWSAAGRLEASLECSASTRPDQAQHFTLTIEDKASNINRRARLQHDLQLVAVLERQDANPVLE